MLTLNILPVCMSKGIFKPFPYLIQHGFPNSAAHSIAAGKYLQPKLAHVERLCLLFGCTPNDILEWTPDRSYPDDTPLAALIPKAQSEFNWIEEIQNLPVDKLKAMSEIMQEQLKKINQ